MGQGLATSSFVVHLLPMAKNDVVLIQVGQRRWPRWMIFHQSQNLYWSKGIWERCRRNGDLWDDEEAAELEQQFAEFFSEGVEDDSHE